ncbi:alpha/beta-hydrolase [Thozetella sp. PMI_491]|nr:alpha/beta-hydrolase [Thozetella sp. PMI_491]
MDSVETKIFALPDGRQLAYGVYGVQDAAAPTIFYFHGFPGSHFEGATVHDAAVANGVRVIATSRPGYGGSTFQHGRKLTDYPADILALADHLTLDRFGVLGVSGGGPYALSCHMRIPRDRLAGVGVVAGLMPLSLGTEGMMWRNRALFWLVPWLTTPMSWVIDSELGAAARDTKNPNRTEELMDKDFSTRPGADAQAWKTNPTLRSALVQSLKGAMKEGGYPSAWEGRILASKWGFELSDLEVEPGRMVLWHGDQDINVPLGMSKKATAMMPGSELRILKGHGHLSVVLEADDFITTMKEMVSQP